LNGSGPGRRAAAAVLLVSVVFIADLAAWGRFPGTDETYFKAPGYNLATNGHFRAPELTGVFGLDPPVETIWAVYPPLYPFLFGQFVRLFGFGYRQCVLFDALVAALGAAAACLLLSRRAPRAPWWIFPAMATALLTLAHPEGRPDQLGLLLGLLAIVAMTSRERPLRSAALSGLWLGLAAATTVAAALVLGVVVAAEVVLEPTPPRTRIARLFVCGGVAAAVLALVVTPIVLSHPHAFDQFLTVARGPSGLKNRDLASLISSWRLDPGHQVVLLTCAAIGAISARVLPRGVWVRLWGASLLALLVAILIGPSKYYYFWFAGPPLLTAACATLFNFAPRPALPGVRWLLTAGLLIGAAPFLKDRWVMRNLPPAQSYAAGRAALTSAIPAGASVLGSEIWWTLAGRNPCYEIVWSSVDLDKIDYVAVSGNGSGAPGRPHTLPGNVAPYVESHFEPLVDDLNRRPTTLLGLKVTNSAYGFGPLILARRPAATSVTIPRE
jgi:hypothetical protein